MTQMNMSSKQLEEEELKDTEQKAVYPQLRPTKNTINKSVN